MCHPRSKQIGLLIHAAPALFRKAKRFGANPDATLQRGEQIPSKDRPGSSRTVAPRGAAAYDVSGCSNQSRTWEGCWHGHLSLSDFLPSAGVDGYDPSEDARPEMQDPATPPAATKSTGGALYLRSLTMVEEAADGAESSPTC